MARQRPSWSLSAGCAAALLLAGLTVPLAGPAAAAALPGADSGAAVHHDTSGRLSAYPPIIEPADTPKHVHRDKRDAGLPQRSAAKAPDGALQTTAASTAAPTASGFEGLGAGLPGFTVSSAPPDTDAAVSATQLVEVVNSGFAVFSKSGTVLYGPAATQTLWTGFGGACETTNDGDGVVRYDRAAKRWLIAQFANVASRNGPYYECLAVSTTDDATGSYYRYAFSFSSFPDYPKIGVWPDAYYATYNLFSRGVFAGAEACAMDRAGMLAGRAVSQQCFVTSTAYGGLLPADNAGSAAPPAGSPALHVALGTTTSALAAWQFHVDWSNPSASTFTGPVTVPTAAYSQACGGGSCIAQPATSNLLDSLGDRVMYHLSYRNNAGVESLVLTHSVDVGTSTGVRWYELRNPSSTPAVYQQGTYAPDGDARWMGSAAMDGSGGIALGYSVSGPSTYPSIRVAGRAAGDPLGTLTTGEGSVVAGTGAQTGTLSRWGDYASMSVDPADDCTFWFASEYLAASGTFNWHTRIGSFKLAGCGATSTPPVANDFAMTLSPTSGSTGAGGTVSSTVSTRVTTGSPETVALSASGLPAGATATFTPAQVTAGSGSTMTVATSASTPPGSYALTVTGTAPSATHSATYTLTVTSPDPIVNGGFETGDLSGWSPSGAVTGVSTTAHSGRYSAQLGTTTPTNGDSSVAQSFTAPAGSSTLSFWWQSTCPDAVQYDWATATLADATTGVTTTVLPRTCTAVANWAQVTASVVPGHRYTLTLTNHDDNWPGDATFSRFDDVTVG